MKVVNTRNRPPDQREHRLSGSVGALIRLTQSCEILERLSDKYPELRNNKKIALGMRMAVKGIYSACSLIEERVLEGVGRQRRNSVLVEESPLLHLQGEGRTIPLDVEQEEFYDDDGQILSDKLYTFAHEVGPWECEDNTCANCPFGENPEEQRVECLEFYLIEAGKQIVIDELAAGVPYTRSQLEGFSRKDLLMLVDVLGVNRFKLKDTTKHNLLQTVLAAQSEIERKLQAVDMGD